MPSTLSEVEVLDGRGRLVVGEQRFEVAGEVAGQAAGRVLDTLRGATSATIVTAYWRPLVMRTPSVPAARAG
ncbi:hypothetical protein KBX37_21940 [Micromonospora sp. U56]|uniref:hypothetical protein n=1 Tax=Micromonospora sp. U56 TaxID=2824900 RepID=UPI001B38D77B|nr:hypothetical protein [Micromonospora sp. U56]MBQ0895725.1 hypothetical protein [Micromonospora sp. U56]